MESEPNLSEIIEHGLAGVNVEVIERDNPNMFTVRYYGRKFLINVTPIDPSLSGEYAVLGSANASTLLMVDDATEALLTELEQAHQEEREMPDLEIGMADTYPSAYTRSSRWFG